MKRKLVLCTLAAMMCMTCGVRAEGEGEMLPLRITLESMGYDVGWSAADRSITASKEGESLAFKEGSTQVSKNGEIIVMSGPVEMAEGITYIPSSAVEELALTSAEPTLSYKMNESFDANTNYVFSPFGFKSAAAMLANAAAGESRQEVLTALGYTDIDSLNGDMRRLNELYSTDTEISEEDTGFAAVVNSANSIWVEESCPQLSAAFTDLLENDYSASLQRTSARDYPEKAKEWIKEQSGGLQDIDIQPTEDFALSIINTLYLKADWQSKFEEEDTAPGAFTNADGSVGTVDYMHTYLPTEAYVDDRVTMVRLDYRDSVLGKDLSFYAAMADPHIHLENYIDRMEYRDVNLSLPKFETNSSADMKETAKALGISKVFTTGADFSNAFEENAGGIFLSSILQDTLIGVDEEGTQAASTTRVTLAGSLAEPQYVEITFDQPFTYFIRDNDNGEILFMGRFANGN